MEKNLTCDICDRNFTSKSNLNRHNKTIHANSDKTESKIEDNFNCAMCQEKFTSVKSINDHTMEIHKINLTEKTLNFNNIEGKYKIKKPKYFNSTAPVDSIF